MRPLHSPRRIATSLLVFLFFAGGSGAVFGFVSAGADDGVAPFIIPEPRSGDVARYAAYDASEGRDGAPQIGELRVTWRDDITLFDPYHGMRTAHAIQYNSTVPDSWGQPFGQETVLLDTTTLLEFGWVEEWSDDYDHIEPSPGTVVVGDSWSLGFYEGGGWNRMPCGVVSPFHGRPVDVGDAATGIACDGVHRASERMNKAQAIRVDEETGERYLEVWINDGWIGRPDAKVWYSEDVPLPVRIEVPDQVWPDIDVHYELVAYERGPPVPMPGPAAPRPIEVDMAPTTPWMFDETGIDHPFPASEAYQMALDDPESGLEAFLNANPDAYMVDLWASQDHTQDAAGDRSRIIWRMTFRDDDSIHEVSVWRTERAEAPSDPTDDPVAFVMGTLAEQQAPVVEYDVRQIDADNLDRYGPFVPKPTELPTVASMWDVFDAFASDELRELGPNMWSLTILGSEDTAQWDHRILVDAGHGMDTHTDTGTDTTTKRNWAYAEWKLEDSNLPFRYSERGYREERVPVAQQAAAHDVHGAGAVSVARVWELPSSPQAAGIGIGAMLISLLYHFWPALKTGGLGLFSRVQPEALLEHPIRQSIHDHVQANPGSHYKQIVRSQDASRSTVDHHLRKLAQAGILVANRSHGYTCYYVKGAVDRRAMAAQGAVKSPVASQILGIMESAPGIRTNELARRLGVAPATVSYHMRRLKAAGLVEPAGLGHSLTDLARGPVHT